MEPTELPGSKLYTGYSSVITREYTLLAFHHLYKFFGGKISFMCQIKEVVSSGVNAGPPSGQEWLNPDK